jgi:hypothetical protein
MKIGHGAPRDIKNYPFYFSTSYQFAAKKPIRISDPPYPPWRGGKAKSLLSIQPDKIK